MTVHTTVTQGPEQTAWGRYSRDMEAAAKTVAILLAGMIAIPLTLTVLPAGIAVLIPLAVWALNKDIIDEGADGEGIGPLHLTRRTLLELELLANSNERSPN